MNRITRWSWLMLVALAGPLMAQNDLQSRQEAAAAVSNYLLQTLSTALQAELAKGPAAAVGVCTITAPALASRLSRQTGWQVTRVGTRVRNPLLGMPDAWERSVLEGFAARADAGENLAQMSYGEMVSANGASEFRYMKAIGVQPACLSCHGNSAQIPAAVQDALVEHYPLDQATGYAAGDLRGAVSIRQPLALALEQATLPTP